ncbi:MAG: RNA polymerase sigma factor [Planctomycetes bacterium]|nr:RNA polymerase sigma factor [Planctomycetota bacterium]
MSNPSLSVPTGALEEAPVPAEVSDREILERFILRRDEEAFASLVRRHGPMVKGVCERLLHHTQDAEDAFQATFLVLVRKAGSLQKPELLGNWLYGVAFRTACKARTLANRRDYYERQAAAMPSPTSSFDPNWREMRALLDEELQTLPFKYRAPLVLCYLEGFTNEEAALRLGWPIGSMSYRLARGRELLRGRLNRRNRNHAVPAGMFALFLQQTASATELQPALVQTTAKAAVVLATGHGLAAALSANAQALAEQTLRALAATGRRGWSIATFAVLAIALAFAAVVAFGIGYNTNPPWPPEAPAINGAVTPGCNKLPIPRPFRGPHLPENSEAR